MPKLPGYDSCFIDDGIWDAYGEESQFMSKIKDLSMNTVNP